MSRQNFELTGQKIQGYTIAKPIGQGKFSIVYRAQNEQGVPFALKKIKIFDMADQRQREKCLREVDIMKKLSHPHIIRYIDSFIHNNELIIVTQWAQKGDLKKLIKQKEAQQLQFDEVVIWQFMKQISSALQHMHEKRIMHRDLKPANIFISSDGSLKIGDLGLGRSFSSETLEAYSKVGTPLYMSPQLIQDSGYTQNADVWSLGCICYQLAQLKSPFRNKEQKMSLMDLFDNITKCNYKQLQARFSPQLREAIRNMIVVDPTKRWSSEQVFNYAMKCLDQVKRPLLDPIIAMDDISIKLGLLNYEEAFCKVAQLKPIHKLYFAIRDEKGKPDSQLYYFLELSYWVMGLSKPDKRKDKLAIYTKTLIDWNSPQGACSKLLVDLSDYGIKVEEGVGAQSIRNGYGEAICYLLNQILTRELIRMNFQFKAPATSKEQENNRDDVDEDRSKTEKQIQEQERDGDGEQSLEEQPQFQQSILFNKNNRRQRNNDGGFIDKIEELEEEENRMMIVGRADQKEWKGQCLRLEKKFNQITAGAKDARKKNGYMNIQTSKICSAKLTDLIKYVKPTTSIVFKNIDQDLEKIRKGEGKIGNAFQGLGQVYSHKNQERIALNNRLSTLSSIFKDNMAALEKTEQKLQQFKGKIDLTANSETQSRRLVELKGAVVSLRRQLLDMQQKKEILSWELRRHLLRQKNKGKDDYLEINYLEQNS